MEVLIKLWKSVSLNKKSRKSRLNKINLQTREHFREDYFNKNLQVNRALIETSCRYGLYLHDYKNLEDMFKAIISFNNKTSDINYVKEVLEIINDHKETLFLNKKNVNKYMFIKNKTIKKTKSKILKSILKDILGSIKKTKI